jgi:hypothetical protein
MSIVMFAKLVQPMTLADVFADMHGLVPARARAPLRIVSESTDPASILLAPFPVAEYERDGRRYKEDFATWDRKGVDVAMGTVACIEIRVNYHASIEDSEVGTHQPTESDLEYDRHSSGYHVSIDAGFLRTKASYCLGVLMVTAIARRSGVRIQDECGHLTGNEWVEVSHVIAAFAKHADASSFEAFADGFTNDVGLAPHWADSVTLVGTGLLAR